MSDFPFKNFCKLVRHAETIRKKCLGKEYGRVPVVDKSTDHNINAKENVFFFRARAEKSITRHLGLLIIDNSKLANQIARFAAIVVKNRFSQKETTKKKKIITPPFLV